MSSCPFFFVKIDHGVQMLSDPLLSSLGSLPLMILAARSRSIIHQRLQNGDLLILPLFFIF